MNSDLWNSLNLFRAQTMVVSDSPTKPVDAILLHTRPMARTGSPTVAGRAAAGLGKRHG